MTVKRVPCILKMDKSSEKISQQQSRQVTDQYAFRLYPIFVAVYIMFYIMHMIGLFLNRHRRLVNETWENKTYSDSPSEAISNVVLLINGTLRAVQDENLYKNPSIAIIIGLLKALCFVGVAYLMFIRIIAAKFINTHHRIFNMEYMHHYTVINGSKMIISVLCLIVLKSQWNEPSETFKVCVLFWGVTEFFNFYSNLMSFVASRRAKTKTSTLKEILRFYYLRRKLLFFQLLNFLAMLSFVASVVVVVKIYCECSMVTYQFVLVGSFGFIALMHTCAKMTIMLASASHNWDEDDEGVSWKLILSSLWTIIRYHVGSIIFYFPVLECMSYEDSGDIKDCTKEELYIQNNPILTMECSEMLIAIHGQYFGESNNTLRHSKIKSWISKSFESVTSMVWWDMMGFSCLFLALCMIILLSDSISAAEDLLTIAIYALTNILINVSYYYVIIKPVNVIETTIEFSKIVTKEELKIMELELLTETNEPEVVSTEP